MTSRSEASRHAQVPLMVALAESGMSARQIGAQLGCSRNAVLGALFRARVAVARPVRPAKPPKPPRQPRAMREPGPERPLPEFRETRLPRQPFAAAKGGVFPVDFKVRAVALVLSARGDYDYDPARARNGMGYIPTAKALGVDAGGLAKWCRDPRFVIRAETLAAEMRQERIASRQLAEAVELIAEEALATDRDEHNRAVLERFTGRARRFAARLLDGENFSAIGISVGLTRERIRQIAAPVIAAGLITDHLMWGPRSPSKQGLIERPPKRLKLPKPEKPARYVRKGWSPAARAAAAQRMRERYPRIAAARRERKAEWLYI